MHRSPLLTRLASLATGTLANALDESGLHDKVITAIHAVTPGLRCAGRAVTVRQSSGGYGRFDSGDFRVGDIIDAAQPGDVIVIDAGGALCSTWGGMAACAAKAKGIEGVVVNGGVRDLEELLGFGFPTFARHLVPTTGRTRLKVESINLPIGPGGVVVAPGDFVVADGTGVVCLPSERAEAIVELAEQFARDDRAAQADLEAGMSFAEVMAKYRRI